MLRDAPFDIPPSQWDAAVREAQSAMAERARKGGTMTYSQLVGQIQSLHLEPHDPRLFHLLGQISSEEDAAGRGLLTAVVVHAGDRQPGEGFFTLARSLGYQFKDELEFWSAQLTRVYDAWQPRNS